MLDLVSPTLGLLETEFIVVMTAIISGVVLVISIVTLGTRAGIRTRSEREETKREIAAYVAEGSISPDEGARMIAASESGKAY